MFSIFFPNGERFITTNEIFNCVFVDKKGKEKNQVLHCYESKIPFRLDLAKKGGKLIYPSTSYKLMYFRNTNLIFSQFNSIYLKIRCSVQFSRSLTNLMDHKLMASRTSLILYFLGIESGVYWRLK